MHLGEGETEPCLVVLTSTDVWQLFGELPSLQEWRSRLTEHAAQPGKSVTAAVAALPAAGRGVLRTGAFGWVARPVPPSLSPPSCPRLLSPPFAWQHVHPPSAAQVG